MYSYTRELSCSCPVYFRASAPVDHDRLTTLELLTSPGDLAGDVTGPLQADVRPKVGDVIGI